MTRWQMTKKRIPKNYHNQPSAYSRKTLSFSLRSCIRMVHLFSQILSYWLLYCSYSWDGCVNCIRAQFHIVILSRPLPTKLSVVREGMIMCKAELAKSIDSAVFPVAISYTSLLVRHMFYRS